MESEPEYIQIKQLGIANAAVACQLFLLLQQVFDIATITPISKTYAENLLANPDFIAFAAFRKDELAGGLTAYVLPMTYAEYAEVYIYDVAVKPEFQRMGIGKKLLAAIKDYCRQNEIKEIFVQADEADQCALDFYRAMGGIEEKVRHFTYRP